LFVIIFLMLTNIITTFAQRANNQDSTAAANKTNTLFSVVKPKLQYTGLYFANDQHYATIAGANVWAQGASGMLLFNKKIGVGLSGYGTQRFVPTLAGNTGLSMRYGVGGALLEYTVKPNSVLHITFPLLIGAGYARLDSGSSNYNHRGDGHNHNDTNNIATAYYAGTSSNFAVIQPGIRAELNVVKIAKVYAGASYRIATSSALSYPTATTAATVGDAPLSGLSINAGIKIGLFDVDMKKKRHFGRRFGRHLQHRNNQRHHQGRRHENSIEQRIEDMPPPPPPEN
jgi:hypothetical protein